MRALSSPAALSAFFADSLNLYWSVCEPYVALRKSYHVNILIIKISELLCDSRLLKYFVNSAVFEAHRIPSKKPSLTSLKSPLTQPSRSEKVITHAVSVTTTWSRRINEVRCGSIHARSRMSNRSCRKTERRVSTVNLMSATS
jgi:hypothetical protein